CHGHDNIVAVLNTAFGESHTDNLPFDLRHLRWPIKYHLSSDADASETQAVLEALVSNLAGALKLILQGAPVTSSSLTVYDFAPHKSLEHDPAVFSEDVTELIPETPFRFQIDLKQL